ncbi:hypothetical protein JKP88DRAFT_281443 [Tribonema minus]|uniref:Uncharacterized protein n=1 Tax=Tribonema minus TaxID=303371 RepID=A0A836CB85_9STRA|nr:hypothetical protein JKP88DRAFT_281443 [Tribonema minus]
MNSSSSSNGAGSGGGGGDTGGDPGGGGNNNSDGSGSAQASQPTPDSSSGGGSGSGGARRIPCKHAAVFLVGESVVQPAALRDWLEGEPLVLELHDRDAAAPPLPDQAASAIAAAAAAATGAAAPDDAAIDRQLQEAHVARAAAARGAYAHGCATVALGALQLAAALHLSADVCASARGAPPSAAEPASAAERLSRAPGRYLEAGCALGVRASLARPLAPYAETRPFTRAAFVFEYGDGALVAALGAALDAVNAAALGGALRASGCSLRAYCLSAAERAAADAGALDVVCGFAVVDAHCRTVVVEGLADGGVAALLARVPRRARNGGAYRVLADPRVRFARRAYTAFNADLKRVRLRAPLPALCEGPDVYSRARVSAQCFAALDALRQLRRAASLRHARDCRLFPDAAALLEVESKYGESISLEDMFGSSSGAPGSGGAAAAAAATAAAATAAAAAAAEQTSQAPAMLQAAQNGSGSGGGTSAAACSSGAPDAAAAAVAASPPNLALNEAPPRRHERVDTGNAAFARSVSARAAPDFLAAQREAVRAAKREHRRARAARRAELDAETVPTQWCYGPQKLNYTELKKAEMRGRLARARGATFTYSTDFVSQTVSLVDETRMRQADEERSRAAWLTPGGFVYPAPRPPCEYNAHPKKPSASRIDMLREPWVENELHGGRGARTAAAATTATCGSGGEGGDDRPEFDCVPTNGAMLMGGLAAPAYARPFDGGALAERRGRLPRGAQVAGAQRDPGFFTSVHIAGANVEAQREAAAAAQRAKEAWLSRVVVDDLAFHVGGFNVRDRVPQIERTADILKGPPLKAALRRVRNAHLPSGRAVPFPNPPISALSLEPYADPLARRKVEVEVEVGVEVGVEDGDEGWRPEFRTHIHRDRLKPRSQTIVAGRRKIVPVALAEKRGPIWSAPAAVPAAAAAAASV